MECYAISLLRVGFRQPDMRVPMPEEIARVFMNAEPKTEWRYEKDAEADKSDGGA
ncbi:MAG: hypothetical protein OXC83_09100 [Chloroflexi bacterium]|nr:hypothetical protein [Chloroflexota bacterium]